MKVCISFFIASSLASTIDAISFKIFLISTGKKKKSAATLISPWIKQADATSLPAAPTEGTLTSISASKKVYPLRGSGEQ